MTLAQFLSHLDDAARHNQALDLRVNIDFAHVGLGAQGCSLVGKPYITFADGHWSMPVAHPINDDMDSNRIATFHLYGTSVCTSSLPRLRDVISGLEPWLAMASRAAVVLDELCLIGVVVKHDPASGLSYLDPVKGSHINNSKFAIEALAFGRDLVAAVTERLSRNDRFTHDDLVGLIDTIPHGSLVLDNGYYDLVIRAGSPYWLKAKQAVGYWDKYAEVRAAGTAHVMLVDERMATPIDV